MENSKIREKARLLMGENTIKWLTLQLYPVSVFDRKYNLMRKMMSVKSNLDLYPKAKKILLEWVLKQEDDLSQSTKIEILRYESGYGLVDCKTILILNNWSMSKSRNYLKERR